MPSTNIAPPADASPIARGGAPAARKARFWDRIAVKCAADPIADMAGCEATLRRVQGLLSADQDVLEIGCGTGTTALRLAPNTGRLLATDVSAGMIAIAREKLAAEPVPQLDFAVADADEPVAGQGEYDVVLAFNLLHLVTDLDRALGLAAQVLRPGGLLISKTACISEMNPLIPYLALPLMRALGKAPMCCASTPSRCSRRSPARAWTSSPSSGTAPGARTSGSSSWPASQPEFAASHRTLARPGSGFVRPVDFAWVLSSFFRSFDPQASMPEFAAVARLAQGPSFALITAATSFTVMQAALAATVLTLCVLLPAQSASKEPAYGLSGRVGLGMTRVPAYEGSPNGRNLSAADARLCEASVP
jgi:hypothetical protein